MGAHTFFTTHEGATVGEAFSDAVDRAKHMNGHGGYTGTIAEKPSYTEIPASEVGDADPYEYARELIDACDERVDGKWGPAGAIQTADDEWLFFGWASS